MDEEIGLCILRRGLQFQGCCDKDMLKLGETLTNCLIGDLIDKDYTELFDRVSEFAELPNELPHGKVAMGTGALGLALKITILTAGTGSYFCGACMRDN